LLIAGSKNNYRVFKKHRRKLNVHIASEDKAIAINDFNDYNTKKEDSMASITVRKLPDRVKEKLRVIAGIAAYRECSIATRNETDFEGLGIELINPWSDETNISG